MCGIFQALHFAVARLRLYQEFSMPAANFKETSPGLRKKGRQHIQIQPGSGALQVSLVFQRLRAFRSEKVAARVNRGERFIAGLWKLKFEPAYAARVNGIPAALKGETGCAGAEANRTRRVGDLLSGYGRGSSLGHSSPKL